jgi:1-phosphofructokinase family hexose kinase
MSGGRSGTDGNISPPMGSENHVHDGALVIVAIGMNPAMDRILIVPDFKVGETLKAESVAILPSGKATNVAAVMHQLGVPVRFAGFVGKPERDAYTNRLAGIPCEFAEVDGSTRIDTTIIDPVSGTETHVREPGFSVEPSEVDELIDRVIDGLGPGDLVALSGSLPPGAPLNTYANIVGECRSKGIPVFLDSSGKAQRLSVEAIPHFMKPNRDELEELSEQQALNTHEMVSAARDLIDRGVEQIAVSLGSDGALLVTADEAWQGIAEAPQTVNTVGCGDAFACGWISARIAGASVREQLAEALAVGAANAMSHGAGLIDAEHIELMRSRAKTWIVEI